MSDSSPDVLVCRSSRQGLAVNIVARIGKFHVCLLELLCHQSLQNFSDIFKFNLMNLFLACLVFISERQKRFSYLFTEYVKYVSSLG